MSFVYAKKYCLELDGQKHACTNIFSDTKISLFGTSAANWGRQTKRAIEQYGLIKSMIVEPKCCISFAGNNIAHAHCFLSQLYDMKQVEVDNLLELALDTHLSAPKNEIEFIICFADEDNNTEIVCVKEGAMQRDCFSAWIGSYDAFRCMQEYLLMSSTYPNSISAAFDYAIGNCGDPSVGGFSIGISFDKAIKQFVYQAKLLSVYERPQNIAPNSLLKIGGSAEEGAYTAIYHETSEEVQIEIPQADITILYTKKYRLHREDVDNPYTKYFLLPIIVETSSGKVLKRTF